MTWPSSNSGRGLLDWDWVDASSLDTDELFAEAESEIEAELGDYVEPLSWPILSRLPGEQGAYQTEEERQSADFLTRPFDSDLVDYRDEVDQYADRYLRPATAYGRSLDMLSRLLGLGGLWQKNWLDSQKRQILSIVAQIRAGRGTPAVFAQVADILGLKSAARSLTEAASIQRCGQSRAGGQQAGRQLLPGCELSPEAEADFARADESSAQLSRYRNYTTSRVESTLLLEPLRLWSPRTPPLRREQGSEWRSELSRAGFSRAGQRVDRGQTPPQRLAGVALAESGAIVSTWDLADADDGQGLRAGSRLGYGKGKSCLRLPSGSTESELRTAQTLRDNLLPIWVNCVVTPYQFVLGQSVAGHAVFSRDDRGQIAESRSSAQPAQVLALLQGAQAAIPPLRVWPSVAGNFAQVSARAGLASINTTLLSVKQLRSQSRAGRATSGGLIELGALSYIDAQANYATAQAFSPWTAGVVAGAQRAESESRAGILAIFSVLASAEPAKTRTRLFSLQRGVVVAEAQRATLGSSFTRIQSGVVRARAGVVSVEVETEPITAGYAEVQAQQPYVQILTGNLDFPTLAQAQTATVQGGFSRLILGSVNARATGVQAGSSLIPIFSGMVDVTGQDARVVTGLGTYSAQRVDAQARPARTILELNLFLNYGIDAQASPARITTQGGPVNATTVICSVGRATVQAQFILLDFTGVVAAQASTATAAITANFA